MPLTQRWEALGTWWTFGYQTGCSTPHVQSCPNQKTGATFAAIPPTLLQPAGHSPYHVTASLCELCEGSDCPIHLYALGHTGPWYMVGVTQWLLKSSSQIN